MDWKGFMYKFYVGQTT